MKMSKRILAMLLSVFLLVSAAPLSVAQAAAAPTAAAPAVPAASEAAVEAAGSEISLGLEGYNTDSGRFEFTDGEFRILQLSDVQTEEGFYRFGNETDSPSGGIVDNGIERFSIYTMQNAIQGYKPDLVVMTGDQINANRNSSSFQYHYQMTEENLQAVADHYASIILAADPNVKFAIVFGNHDSDLSVDGATGEAATQIQYDCFKRAFGSNFVDYDEASFLGSGNGKIDVYSDNAVAARVFLFDTQTTCIGDSSGETAGSANRAIVDWYNQYATVPNVVFQHIILNEIAMYGETGEYITAGQTNGLLTGVEEGGINPIRIGGKTQTSRLVLNSTGTAGELNEYPGPYGIIRDKYATKQQFLSMASHQCIGAFFGHDHVNSYSGTCTVYGESVDFYACPALTTEEYYASYYSETGPAPGVRTITLNNTGSSVTVDSEVLDMEQVEVLAASARLYDNEIGVYEGGVPALETVAAPAVLYKGSADNNADPINNQSFGNILQKYIYNYETLHIDTANTTVRFALPGTATLISVMATKSTATDGTVNLNGTTLSMPTPTSVALEDGSKLYTTRLPEGIDLNGVQNIIYKVTYVFKGGANTICGTSCVEDLKIPAGYAVCEAIYDDKATSSNRWNSMLQQKYLFTVTGDNVYGMSQHSSGVTVINSDDNHVIGYSNGWQRIFSKTDVGWNATMSSSAPIAGNSTWEPSVSAYRSANNARYALAYHGYNWNQDGSDTYKVFNAYQKAHFTMSMTSNDATKPPEATIYVDRSATTTTADGRIDYGASLVFSTSHLTDSTTASDQSKWAKNVRDYPTYVAGIGFQTMTSSAELFDYESVIGECAGEGYWRSSTGTAFSTAAKNAFESDVYGTAGDISYNGVFAPNQSRNNVTTTHVNSNTAAANKIPNNGILSYRFTSTGGAFVADDTHLSMIVGSRNARAFTRSGNNADTYKNVVLYMLQPVNLRFRTYDKGDLRALVVSEMRERRDSSGGSVSAFTAWRKALVEAQAVLANAKVDQAMIDSKLTALTEAAAGFSCSPETGHTYDSGVYLKEPTCTEDGIISYTCTTCGHIYTERAPAAHDYVETIITAPTCTGEGFARYVCRRCSDTYETAVPAKGHTSSEWITEINPTVTSTGKMCRRCTDCGVLLDEMTMPMLLDDHVTGITLSSAKEYLNRGETLTLTATVTPASATDKTVLWTSSNTGVATVANGVVTPVAPGITVIIAQTADCGHKDFCLVQVNAVTPINGSHIDEGLIGGLSVNLNGLDDYLRLSDASMTMSYSTDVIGTGTKVLVLQGETIINEFETILYGDVNGDGWYDGTDAYFVRLIANGMVSADALTGLQRSAGDANHDGAIDAADAALLERAGLMLRGVDQTAPRAELETNSAFLAYCGLIDQTVEADQPVEADDPPTAVTTVLEWIMTMLKLVWNWLLSILHAA